MTDYGRSSDLLHSLKPSRFASGKTVAKRIKLFKRSSQLRG